MRDSLFQKAAKNVKTFGFLVLTFLVSGILVSAQTIYSNGTFTTGATAGNGTAAPAGFQWSEVQSDFGNTTTSNTGAGSACASGAFRLADDFNVPVGQTWTINTVSTFGYLTGATANPFTAGVLQIWRGRPGDAGSVVVFGDATTNRLASTVTSNAYRVFNTVTPAPGTATGTTRQVWQNNLTVSPALVLTAGNYWIDYGTTVNSTPATAHFCPAVTYRGTRSVPGWNGRQFTVATAAWADATDAGNPAGSYLANLEFPFLIGGTVTGSPAISRTRTMDFNGDNRSDWSVVRSTSATTQSLWANLFAGTTTIAGANWGTGVGFSTGDRAVPADYDGDGRTDVAVWRSGAAGTAAFYILNSATSTARIEAFGQTGDDPSVVADYNSDGRADLATYRAGAQSVFYYRTTANGAVTFRNWGVTGDKPIPADYDGDGSADVAVVRNQSGQAVHYRFLSATNAAGIVFYGLFTDRFVTSDFDADNRADVAAVRANGANYDWYVLKSGTGALFTFTFGLTASDYIVPGDYDGDGKGDFTVWRSGGGAANFHSRLSGSSPALVQWGTSATVNTAPDYPAANFNVR